MKNIRIAIALLFSLALNSCYEDYIKDYDYTGVYFPYQTNVRTVVVGEGMKIEVGASLGGVMNNVKDRQVNYVLDNTLITPGILSLMQGSSLSYIADNVAGLTELKPMPENYYTISSNSMIIKKGQMSGTVVIRPDSLNFLSDPATLKAQYVLPFLITTADADSVLQAKKYTVIGLRYENMLYGNYYHGGVTVVKDDVSGDVVSTTNYFMTLPQADKLVWNLKTVAPNALVTSGISNKDGSFKITLNGETVTISKADGSTVDVQPNGTSTFNRSKLLQDRKIYLNYKYSNGNGTTSYATDTLTFRNRVRDGVNEWLDENPAHYK